MSKIEELKQTYLKDADLMASKSRFGYFSIPLNANAGLASTSDKKCTIYINQSLEIKMGELSLNPVIFSQGLRLLVCWKRVFLIFSDLCFKEILTLIQIKKKVF